MSSVDKETGAAGQKVINLALQGGGTHGGFTWGVLDRLLEDERLTFEGPSSEIVSRPQRYCSVTSAEQSPAFAIA